MKQKQGVGERKYELDSLAYPIRLAHSYWMSTGDAAPFDPPWALAMQRAIETIRVQQLKHGPEPYHFGGQILMDDANTPGPLRLPYLNSSRDAALYVRT